MGGSRVSLLLWVPLRAEINQGEGDNARLLSLGAPVNAQIKCVEAEAKVMAASILQTLGIANEDSEWCTLAVRNNEEMVLCHDA